MALDDEFFDQLAQWGAQRDIVWDVGLSSQELDAAEAKWSFKFPPDLRWLLGHMSSQSKGFIHWIKTPDKTIRERLDGPFQGLCFDIESNDLWLADWGPKPETLADQLSVFERIYRGAPRLIPIYSHRYIPSEPSEPGNPVFSIHQSDIIHYGSDLRNFLENEFGPSGYELGPVEKRIDFWTYWTEHW